MLRCRTLALGINLNSSKLRHEWQTCEAKVVHGTEVSEGGLQVRTVRNRPQAGGSMQVLS